MYRPLSLVILHKPVCHVRPTLFRRAASAWWHQGIKYLLVRVLQSNFFFPLAGRRKHAGSDAFEWTTAQARDALMPSDRRTDALPEYGTIRFPKGDILVRLETVAAAVGGTRTDAWFVCLLTSPRAFPLVCLTSPAITT
jgi:hypothetical protein